MLDFKNSLIASIIAILKSILNIFTRTNGSMRSIQGLMEVWYLHGSFEFGYRKLDTSNV